MGENSRFGVIAADRVDVHRFMVSHLRFARSSDLFTLLSGSLSNQVAHPNEVVAGQRHHPL